MKLSEFIRKNQELIIEDWVAFAGSLLPWAEEMTEEDKRDHAKEMLDAVVADMEAPQSKEQQASKSKGHSVEGALARVGHKHASHRAGSGFNLDHLVSEYRALRASILLRWSEASGDKDSEVTRFNEAIDESLVEAAVKYSELLEHTKDQFLAILGHDLRNPLSTIMIGATALTDVDDLDDKQARVAARILRSAERMNRMVNDLLDFTRASLGQGIPVTRRPMDLGVVCQQLVSDLETRHADGRLRCQVTGDLHGEWDSDRVAQVLANLVDNALHYGADSLVSVVAEDAGEEVVLRIHNGGPPIPPAALKKIFEPMVRHATQSRVQNTTGMGLGLYIAREIVTSHAGTVEATSAPQDGTTFTVTLPRRKASPGSRKVKT